MDKAKIIEKIRKVLRLAEAAGTEAEAAAAAHRARIMMRDYQLSEEAVQAAEESPEVAIEENLKVTNRNVPVWAGAIALAVAAHCDVGTYKTNNGTITFYGLPDDVALAAYMFRALHANAERLATAYRQILTCETGRASRARMTDYRRGVARGYHDKLRAEKNADAAEHTAECTALTLRKNEALAAYRRGLHLSGPRTTHTRHSADYEHGYRAGRAASVTSALPAGTATRPNGYIG